VNRRGCFAIIGSVLGAVAGGTLGVLAVVLNKVSQPSGRYGGGDFGALGVFIESCIFAFAAGALIGAIVGSCSGFLFDKRPPT
jgi:hypothetical protein